MVAISRYFEIKIHEIFAKIKECAISHHYVKTVVKVPRIVAPSLCFSTVRAANKDQRQTKWITSFDPFLMLLGLKMIKQGADVLV